MKQWNLGTNQGEAHERWRSTTNTVFHKICFVWPISMYQFRKSSVQAVTLVVMLELLKSRTNRRQWNISRTNTIRNHMKRQLLQQCGVINSEPRESVNRTRTSVLVAEIYDNCVERCPQPPASHSYFSSSRETVASEKNNTLFFKLISTDPFDLN